jgi:3',5'-cyclic AMP phosphodiesterase CpdA
MGDVQQGYQEWGDLLQVAARENPGPKFALLGGDVVNDSTQEQWQQLFAAASPLFSQISLLPAAGNHDESTTGGAALFWNSFAVPQNGPDGYKEFYSFDYENAHIVVLDSNLLAAPGTGEFNTISVWLRKDLSSSSKTWKFVVLHYPPYQVFPDDHVANIQTNWAPIFEQCGVDVVFDGHQQVYARTSPMKAGQIRPDGDGIVYIMGNAGSKYLPCGPYYNYVVKELSGVSNYEVVNIDGNTFTMTAKDANGQVIDSYQLTKQTAAGGCDGSGTDPIGVAGATESTSSPMVPAQLSGGDAICK